MSTIAAEQVKELREQTGLGMMDCKKALAETGGDMSKAIEFLRKQGAAVAAKRSGRDAKEGKVLLFKDDKIVLAVDINCETDFVAASNDFTKFSNQVVAAIIKEKPADVASLNKLSIDGNTIEELNTAIMAKLGENITVRRFAFEELGVNDYAETYSHMGGKIGVIIKLSASQPFEKSEKLETFAKDLTMQVAASNPISIDAEGIPQDLLDKEKEIYRELALKEGKPEEFVDKIVDGRINKFYKENCLNKQVFIKDSKLTVEKLIEQTANELKIKKLKISVFHRLQLGQ